MANPLSWILLGIGLYWVLLVWLRRQGALPRFIGTQGPIITVHTRRGRALLDQLAAPRRLWRAWGNLGVGIAYVVMVGSFFFLAFAAVTTLRNPTPTAVNQPRNVLVIPGVNDFLPLSVAPEIVAGLLIALVVHEGGHGLLCRVGDIDIESMGIALFAVVPIGAFVEPDDESRRRADRGAQARMFAAGVTNNFAVTLVAFGLLFGPVIAAIGVAPGAAVGGVVPGSPAADAGIEQGDRVLAVGGREVRENDDLDAALSEIEAREVRVRFDDGSGTRTATINRSLLVTGVTAGTPFSEAVEIGSRIAAVNGTAVHTEPALRAALADRRVATIRTAGGESATGPIGAAVRIMADGPAASADLPAGESAVITAIDGTRVASSADLDDALNATRPGETVSVEFYAGGERHTRPVELGEHPRAEKGFLGVNVAPGVSGLTVTDFGVKPYPSGLYLDLLGKGGGGSFLGRIVIALELPLASIVGGPGIEFNFAGFTGGVGNFYVVEGPLAFLGGAWFGLANLLFWTGWINLNLGFFNCIPAFPLDGGHLLRMAAEAGVARLPVERRRDLTTAITTSVGLLMLLALLLTLFGPQILT